MSKLEYMCKGSWALGTACGKCQKCILEAPAYIAHLQEGRDKLRYMVIHNDSHEGSSITHFETRIAADEYLVNQLGNYTGQRLENESSWYELIEYTQDFDVITAVKCHQEKRERLKQGALSKLTDEEIAVLGLTKA